MLKLFTFQTFVPGNVSVSPAQTERRRSIAAAIHAFLERLKTEGQLFYLEKDDWSK